MGEIDKTPLAEPPAEIDVMTRWMYDRNPLHEECYACGEQRYGPPEGHWPPCQHCDAPSPELLQWKAAHGFDPDEAW